jgi:MerR family transcriptional regulator, light-induced transcriptional regulator
MRRGYAERAMGVDVEARVVELRERYVEQIVAGAAGPAQELIADALRFVPAGTVYDEILVPALHEVGRRWACSELTVAEEHLATGICEIVLPDLARELPREARTWRTAIVACSPGELHAIGARIVADYLEAGGWEVLHLGAITPADAVAELVVARNAAMVALSAATEERLPELAAACARLKALPFPPLIAVGGQAIGGEEAARRLGADLYADSPEALCAALGERFPAEA